jgi:hypothetical protein
MPIGRLSLLLESVLLTLSEMVSEGIRLKSSPFDRSDFFFLELLDDVVFLDKVSHKRSSLAPLYHGGAADAECFFFRAMGIFFVASNRRGTLGGSFTSNPIEDNRSFPF